MSGEAVTVKVNMGAPHYKEQIVEQIEVESVLKKKLILDYTFISMGNPHCVIFVANVGEFPVEVIGSQIETNQRFPNRCNCLFQLAYSNLKQKWFTIQNILQTGRMLNL